jgi:hypothetical protein
LLEQALGDGLMKLQDIGDKGGAFPAPALKNLYATYPDVIQTGLPVLIVAQKGFTLLATGGAGDFTHDNLRKQKYN